MEWERTFFFIGCSVLRHSSGNAPCFTPTFTCHASLFVGLALASRYDATLPSHRIYPKAVAMACYRHIITTVPTHHTLDLIILTPLHILPLHLLALLLHRTCGGTNEMCSTALTHLINMPQTVPSRQPQAYHIAAQHGHENDEQHALLPTVSPHATRFMLFYHTIHSNP